MAQWWLRSKPWLWKPAGFRMSFLRALWSDYSPTAPFPSRCLLFLIIKILAIFNSKLAAEIQGESADLLRKFSVSAVDTATKTSCAPKSSNAHFVTFRPKSSSRHEKFTPLNLDTFYTFWLGRCTSFWRGWREDVRKLKGLNIPCMNELLGRKVTKCWFLYRLRQKKCFLPKKVLHPNVLTVR